MARHFTSFEIKELEQNPNVLWVSDRSITYHPEFKIRAVEAHEQGFSPTQIFLDHGFDLSVVGKEQPQRCMSRWRQTYAQYGQSGLERDQRGQGATGRPTNKTLNSDEKLRKAEARIRRANPYKLMMKATQEHKTCKNLLKCEFNQGEPGKVLLTDITYLYYGKGQKAYLFCVKDGATREIVAHVVTTTLKMSIVYQTLKQLSSAVDEFHPEALIHSDQGFHYTHPEFQSKVKQMGLVQSMSRRGNCWDNASMESFFGTFKDWVDHKSCESLEELKH